MNIGTIDIAIAECDEAIREGAKFSYISMLVAGSTEMFSIPIRLMEMMLKAERYQLEKGYVSDET